MSDLPTIRIQGDQQLGRQYIPAARAKLDRLREMLSHRGVAVGGDHGPLADGVYCYIKVAGGVSVIQIVAEQLQPKPPEIEDVLRVMYPDFLSGAVVNGTIENSLLYSFKPTAGCTILHGLPTAIQPVARLAVKPYSPFSLELGNSSAPPEFSQYTKLKPGWYSGAMRKLVQFLMGYGKIPEETVYKPKVHAPEPYYFVEPESRFQKDLRESGLQIRYDWRFSKTHGLVRASDNKWWLVEIADGRGIHAMPLKLYEPTKSDAFREYLDSISDDAGMQVVDTFGGLPIGESIPALDDVLATYVRAGIIVRLADADQLSGFYEHSFYSSACGWAFSESGRRAVNTAWRFADDGVQRSSLYEITMQIGAEEEISPSAASLRLKQFISKRSSDLGDKLHPLLVKCDRLTDGQIADLMRMTSEDAASALDEIELDPIAPASAVVAKVREGKVLWTGRGSPPFKVYEPIMGYLVSHDFRPAVESLPGNYDRRCHAPMYAYFNGDQIREVRFYYIGESGESGIEQFGEQECQYVGEWGTRIRSSSTVVLPFFYTTEIDNRDAIVGTLYEQRNEGIDIGYTAVAYGDNPVRPYECFLTRTKSFRIKTTLDYYASKARGACVAIPQNDREAYYYFERNFESGKFHSESYSFASIGDPNVYLGGRFFIIDGTPEGCGERSTFRRVGELVRNETQCSELADSGPWASRCQQMEPMAYSIPLRAPAGVSINYPDTSITKGWIVMSGEDPIEVYSHTVEGDGAADADGSLFVMTPEEAVQSISMNRNCFGDARAIICAPMLNEQMTYSEGLDPELSGKNVTFIGVYQ